MRKEVESMEKINRQISGDGRQFFQLPLILVIHWSFKIFVDSFDGETEFCRHSSKIELDTFNQNKLQRIYFSFYLIFFSFSPTIYIFHFLHSINF